MSPKESFWIGAKGGLLDKKHYTKMRESVWLFLYLLRSQTGLNTEGEGMVNYGHPLTLAQISREFNGINVRTLRLWLVRLRREQYIRTEAHSNHGLKVWIKKGKSKTKTPRIYREVAANSAHSRHDRDGSSENLRPKNVGSMRDSRHEVDTSSPETRAQSFQDIEVMSNFNSPIPKHLISKNLSYYNNAAAAETAAAFSEFFRKTAREKQLPRGRSEAELDERRRFLLMQEAELAKKYGSARD